MKSLFTLFLLILASIFAFSQNNCLQYSGASGNVGIYNNTAALNPTDVITVEAWINANSWRAAVHEGSIAGKDDWSAGNTGYMLRCGEGGDLSFVISIGGAWIEARTTSNPMTTGTWYHVAGVYDGTAARIYLNGTEVASSNSVGVISTNSVNLEIGRSPADNNRYFDGMIDEVRLWHAALDQGVINAWKDKTISNCHPEYANMIAYFELDDNSIANVMWETLAGNNLNTSVAGASYVVSTNAAFLGSVTGYQNSTASQPNTGSVNLGTTDNEVIRIEVEVYSVIDLTQIRIRTNGTTDVNDIENAKIYYTGTSSTFSTGTQFGATIATPLAPGNNMDFNGTQTLSCGTNYFWVSYDVKAGATLGNVIDARVQRIRVDGTIYNPAPAAPAGDRTIANACNHTIDLTDTFGDGWNGGTVTVSVNGTPVLTNIALAAGSGPDTHVFSASTGDVVNVTRTAAGSYPGEMRIEVKDFNTNTIIALQEPTAAPGLDGTGACAVPNMAYVSSTATQANTSDVVPGSTDQEVIGLEVVMSGTANPLDATEILIRTNGTTNVADIANAKLWYTGTSATFATTTQFGATVAVPPAPGSDMTFSATQTLSDGTNYFWLTYDVQAGATLGNVIDGRFHQVTVGGSNENPTTTEPAGSRTIAINYCASNATSASDSECGNVVLNGDINSISNNTAGTCGQYSDFTGLTPPELAIGSSYQVDVTQGTCGGEYTRNCNVWIDWNQDGDFADANENLSDGTLSSAAAGYTYNIGFTVPAGATPGNTRMRVIVKESGVANDPCAVYTWGETEDYTVTVSNPVPMVYSSSTATQVNTDDISMGANNNEVICLEVVTTGSLSPIDATQIRIRTDGTTDFSSDITNAKVWYTGTSSSFATTNQFSTTIATPSAPGVDMIFNGTQTLEAGTNYFWLTFDVPGTATAGNFVDGLFQSIVVDGSTETPTTSAPAGNRQIIDGCHYTLTLYDSGSDGWNGGTVTVAVNAVNVLTNVTLAGGSSGTFDFVADDGDAITTTYVAGTNPGENRYEITNPNGKYILSDGHDADVPTGAAGTGDCVGVQNFTMNTDAYQTGTNCFIVTEDRTNQSGSVWYNYMVDLQTDFIIEFDVYIGDKDVNPVNDGADGMTFCLQGECSASGGNGASMGFGGITPSIAVEFDSYRNFVDMDDPVGGEDHVAIVSNGSVDHGEVTNLDGPNIVPEFEDDAWHSVIISWNNMFNQFTVHMDGVLVASLTQDIVNTIFGGNAIVFWGFTGGTGLYFNRQEVCVTTFPTNSSALTDISCDPCNEQVEVAQGAASYNWTPNDGSIDDPTIYNPTFTPTTTTTYTVEIEDACGNLLTDNMTIFVGLLPVELLEFEATCDNSKVELTWSTASEENNDRFVVQKSLDSKNWSDIGVVKGSGSTSSLTNYSFVDSKKQEGNVYYRLKQVDFDGSIYYSEAVAARCNSMNELVAFYPNPTHGTLYCELIGQEASYIRVINNLGQVMSVQSIENIQGRIELNLNELISGAYLIQVVSKEGSISHVETIIKN